MRVNHIVSRGMPILLILAAVCFAQDESVFEAKGYKSLFNGTDLTGWTIPEGDNGHWSVIDGVIDYDARSEAKGDKSLWSENEYMDFELHIEWRFKGYGDHLFNVQTILPNGDVLTDDEGNVVNSMVPNSDSGILLKGVGQANLWCWSVGSGELWSVRNKKSLPPEVRAGAVPKENADKPVGQWNALDMIVKGERITVINNGIVVIDNALYPGLNVKGHIGLQHHGGVNPKTGKLQGASSLVQFRTIWIKEL
ncbi:DUF1080 domain-containing protein [candidate division KSB1 bacterium]|nr:DUF1080 domain-containing protein [candidate division KSB1 bacterium]